MLKKECDTGMIISVKGLALGLHHYVWTLERDFFYQFENQDLIDAHIEARVALERQPDRIMLQATLQGSVVRSCDRCLGDVAIPFAYCDGEVILLEPDQDALDLSQYLYDSVCVNLPLQVLHPAGQCDPIMEQKLTELSIN